jgi:hypothetical protein
VLAHRYLVEGIVGAFFVHWIAPGKTQDLGFPDRVMAKHMKLKLRLLSMKNWLERQFKEFENLKPSPARASFLEQMLVGGALR